MTQRTRYVFGAALAGLALGGAPGMVKRANAALVTNADFTFETSATLDYNGSTKPLSSSITGATIGTLIAESGTGSAYGVHAGASTVYSSPAGNGSSHSFSSNGWAAGDYYLFTVPTTGIQNILLTFDQISSGSGPAVFNLLYSTDGTTGTTLPTYTTYTIPYSSASSFWSAGTPQSVDSFSFDLSSITALNNNPNAAFEMVFNGSTTPFLPTSSFSTSGTDRIDNVVVAGTAIPEPASLSLLTAAAAALLLRRRQV
jgi:hypothetical protein